jgi:hypothetical protein
MGNQQNHPSQRQPQTLLELSLFTAAKLAALNFETYNFYVRMVSLKDLGLPQKLYDLLWRKAHAMSEFELDHGGEMYDDSDAADCICDACFDHGVNYDTGKLLLDCQCNNCFKVINPALLIRYTRLATLRKNERRFHSSGENTYNSDDCSIIERLSKLKQRQLKKQMKKSV